jgi:hypothetical protein
VGRSTHAAVARACVRAQARCEENINFLEAVESYQNMWPEAGASAEPSARVLLGAARAIVDEFLMQGAEQEVPGRTCTAARACAS